ncbi:MAG: ribosomal RNA small subunit methyltransferase A [Chloroflexi bacterium]|nr:ribosomal RNA small subunit methyltransferase A [Chloroflexota bacterium]
MKRHNTITRTSVDARTQLRRLGARAKKGLGQHFLVDRGVLSKIVSAAELTPHDTVIEVGPGLGILTQELVKSAGRVIAVELDPDLAESLQDKLSDSPQLTVLNADILEIDPSELVNNSAYKVVANLPYYIAAPILRHFLEARLKPALMVVMAQKEVAQSIVAGPGDMSILGISVQLYGKPHIVDYVPAESFYPKPKVDSAIVRIDVYSELAVDVTDTAGFFDIVKAGFSTPRKQIRNSLAIGLDMTPPNVSELLEKAKIDPRRRPETLSLEDWARLSQIFIKPKTEKCRGMVAMPKD